MTEDVLHSLYLQAICKSILYDNYESETIWLFCLNRKLTNTIVIEGNYI